MTAPHSSSTRKAFTLIELLMVVMIISILAALTLGAFRFANVKAARDKTKAIVKAIELGLDKYELENGSYPGSSRDPGSPTGPQPTSVAGALNADVLGAKVLYSLLTGDTNGNGQWDSGEEQFMDFGIGEQDKLGMFEGTVGTDGSMYFADPFGNPIQYSVIISWDHDGDEQNPPPPTGYTPQITSPSNPHDGGSPGTNNNATYDLWSYGDADSTTDGPSPGEEDKWIKNW